MAAAVGQENCFLCRIPGWVPFLGAFSHPNKELRDKMLPWSNFFQFVNTTEKQLSEHAQIDWCDKERRLTLHKEGFTSAEGFLKPEAFHEFALFCRSASIGSCISTALLVAALAQGIFSGGLPLYAAYLAAGYYGLMTVGAAFGWLSSSIKYSSESGPLEETRTMKIIQKLEAEIEAQKQQPA